MFTENDSRFFFILGESGLGKTTFLVNLFLSYTKKIFKKYKVKLIPLGNIYSITEIKKILPNAKSTILFIDGFDEFSINENNTKDINDLFELLYNFRLVLISCRTQFYESEKKQPKITPFLNAASNGFCEWEDFYVSPLKDQEVNWYIMRKYHFLQFKKIANSKKIVLAAINLMVRPFLLKNVEFLIEDYSNDEKYKYSLGIYQLLIDKWIERDISKIKSQTIKDSHQRNMFPMLKELARISFEKGLKENNYFLSKSEILDLSKKYSINFDFIIVRTLLTRDDSGNIKFAHKSILEFFLAIESINNEKLRKIVESNSSFDVAQVFLSEYYFFNIIKKLVANCTGFYFSHKEAKPHSLETLTILSMYSTSAIYLTQFEINNDLNAIFRFKKLKEIVFFISFNELHLSELYHIFYSCWLEILDKINTLILPLYYKNIIVEKQWIDVYKRLYRLNIKDITGDFFLQTKHLAYPDITFQTNQNLENYQFNLELSENDSPIETIIKKVYNHRLINILCQLSTISSGKVRTMAKTNSSILTFSSQSHDDANQMNNMLAKVSSCDVNTFIGLDKKIKDFTSINFEENAQVRLYY